MAQIVLIEDNNEIKEWFKNYFDNLSENNYIQYLNNIDQIKDITFSIETPFFINSKYGNDFQICTHYLIRYNFDFEYKKPDFTFYIKLFLENIEDVNVQIKCHQQLTDKLILNDSKVQIVIPLKDILYIERIKRYSLIKTENRIFQTKTTFAELLPNLNSNFIQCHRSYIVNLNEVREYFHSEFNLNNGEIIPISRNYSKSVEEKWKHYILYYKKKSFK